MPDTVLRLKHFFALYLIGKKNCYLLKLLCVKLKLSTKDIISPILTTAIRGKYYAHLMKEETEEKGDVKARRCHSQESLPCIIWHQGRLAGSTQWVGTPGSALDGESGEIESSVPSSANFTLGRWLQS